MSLYNMLFGVNPFSTTLLEILGISEADVPRYRDCYLNDDGSEIIVHTRTGGGNREAYEFENDCMKKVAGYLYDEDDDFDCTYADFHYRVPEPFRGQVALLKNLGAVSNPAERWQQLLNNLHSRNDENPDVQRAIAVGERILDKITEILKQ